MQTPKFWQKENSIWSTLLTPASVIYSAGSKLLQKKEPYKSTLPVICVGNVTVGGSGKTPTVQSLYNIIKNSGLAQNPCILSRGYGGIKTNHLVTNQDTYTDVGDEAYYLSQTMPVVVDANRKTGAQLIEENGFDLIIMDDGLQNMSLHKDISFLVINGTYGFGNQKILPAGPMRENISDVLKRTDAIILIEDDTYGVKKILPNSFSIFEAAILPYFPEEHKSHSYIGFCGIGEPKKFQRTLKSLNLNIKEFIAYNDHHPFSDLDVKNLIVKAKEMNVRLITTEKDAVRLENFPEIEEYLNVVPIELTWNDQSSLQKFLSKVLSK